MSTPRRRATSKTPTVGRIFVVLWSLWGSLARAQESGLEVEDAVRAALARPALQQRLESQERLARALQDERVLRPTPRLGAGYDQLFGGDNIAIQEVELTLSQEFDWIDWRAGLREATQRRQEALRAQHEEERLELATATREAFFEVRYVQERLAVLGRWRERLEEAIARTRARHERGDASRYELLRLERELQRADAEAALERARLSEAWSSLRHHVPWGDDVTLRGELSPPPSPPHDHEEDHPRLVQLGALQEALTLEADTWDGALWRGWTLGAGYHGAQMVGATGHGFLLSLSLPLPLWDPLEPKRAAAQSQRREVEAERALAEAEIERHHVAARARLRDLREELAALPLPDDELTRLAELAWASGELPLSELLDAWRSDEALRLAHLDLQWEARRAYIELTRHQRLEELP
jgi:cobalt-zinc-cadmium efflux system outer membrane protein